MYEREIKRLAVRGTPCEGKGHEGKGKAAESEEKVLEQGALLLFPERMRHLSYSGDAVS